MKKPTNGLDKRPQDINRAGRPRLSKGLRVIREYETSEIIDTFSKIIDLTIKQAELLLKAPDCTLLEKSLIEVMQKGQINIVIDRLLGRVPESSKITIEKENNQLSDLSEEELENQIMRHIEELILGNDNYEKKIIEILEKKNRFRALKA